MEEYGTPPVFQPARPPMPPMPPRPRRRWLLLGGIALAFVLTLGLERSS